MPPGGFQTDEDDARWLEQTILMRAEEVLGHAGIKAKINPAGLYELILGGAKAARRRAMREISVVPRGCICPAGSEKTCKGIGCPRAEVWIG
jgi:hypothetical protein